RERPARDGGRRARAPVGPRAAGLGREPGQPLRPRCPPDAGAPAPRPPLLLRPPHRHHRSLAGAPAGDHLLGQPQGEPEPGPARAPRPRPAAPPPRGPPPPPARRPRPRRSSFGPRTGTTDPLLAPLLETISSVSPKENLSLVQRAYRVAERAHSGQTRRSGDPYI